jgi:hypothetical protein
MLWNFPRQRFFTMRKKRFATGTRIGHAKKFTTSRIPCELPQPLC